MCGRYEFFLDPGAWDPRWKMERLREAWKKGEVFPTDLAAVLTENQEAQLLTWGFPNFKNKGVLINARVETAGQKPTFKEALRSRRCAVPASAFYEWDQHRLLPNGKKQKYRFYLPGKSVLYLAGLWSWYQGEKRFVILTAPANASIEDLHGRMPVIVSQDGLADYLQDFEQAQKILSAPLPALAREAL